MIGLNPFLCYKSSPLGRSLLSCKVLAYGVVVSICAFLAVGSFMLYRASHSLEGAVRNQKALAMQSRVDTANAAIEMWVSAHRSIIADWSRDTVVVSLVNELIKDPASPIELRENATLAAFREYIQPRIGLLEAQGFFIVGRNDISYGSMRNSNLGTVNFLTRYHPVLIEKVWNGQTVLIPPVPSDVSLDHRYSDASDYHSMFMATPVYGPDASPVAIMTLRFDSTKIVDRILRAGAFDTHEDAYAFDQHLRLVTQPASASASGGRGQNATSGMAQFFTSRVVVPGDGEYRAKPTKLAELALSARSGSLALGYISYHGQRVIGACRWNDDLAIGIACEVLENDALAQFRNARVLMRMLGISMSTLSIISIASSFVFLTFSRRSTNALRTDVLTGLANKRYIFQQLEIHMNAARRSEMPLSLIMIDVDHFKAYNDTYGHVRGDQCLKEVAKQLNGVCQRSTDLAGRFGGEEFVILLPMTNPVGAARVAWQIQERMRQAAIPHIASPVDEHVTLSIGVAVQDVDNSSQTPEELILEADTCLYEAKSNGRNRIIMAKPETAAERMHLGSRPPHIKQMP